jgi:hypothetical protein
LRRASSSREVDPRATNTLLEQVILRRRRAVANVLVCNEERRSERRRSGNVPRDIRSFEHVVMDLPANLVSRMLCMPLDCFFALADETAAQQHMVPRCSWHLRELFITPRYLAASYLDLCSLFGLPVSSLYVMIDAKIAAIDEALRLNFPFRDQNFLRKIAKDLGEDAGVPSVDAVVLLTALLSRYTSLFETR